jgi:hypothetical protein
MLQTVHCSAKSVGSFVCLVDVLHAHLMCCFKALPTPLPTPLMQCSACGTLSLTSTAHDTRLLLCVSTLSAPAGVDLFAPGVNIMSSYYFASDPNLLGSGARLNGTSQVGGSCRVCTCVLSH